MEFKLIIISLIATLQQEDNAKRAKLTTSSLTTVSYMPISLKVTSLVWISELCELRNTVAYLRTFLIRVFSELAFKHLKVP